VKHAHSGSNKGQPEFVALEGLASGMPGFNAADVVISLVHRVNAVGLSHPDGVAKTEAFNAREGVKASLIPELPCIGE
jgi:hypothetical protein